MGQPAAVAADQVNGICPLHLIPSPVGAPMPSPPMPFSAPIEEGVCATVLLGGAPALVLGAQGTCTPPHVGLHPADPYMLAPLQQAVITSGSATVLFGGTPAARSGDTATICGLPGGTVTGSCTNVVIGG